MQTNTPGLQQRGRRMVLPLPGSQSGSGLSPSYLMVNNVSNGYCSSPTPKGCVGHGGGGRGSCFDHTETWVFLDLGMKQQTASAIRGVRVKGTTLHLARSKELLLLLVVHALCQLYSV